MSENTMPVRRCATEACPRPAEPGETLCAVCALERSLYFRDRREDPVEIRTEGSLPERRR